MPSLDIGARRIEYSVVKGTGRRYTYFRFRPDMTLEVIVPRGKRVDPESEIKAMKDWVLREFQRISTSRQILEDDRVMFGGKYLRLEFFAGLGENLQHDASAGTVTIKSSEKKRVKELLRRWFLKETSSYVVKKVSELAPKMDVRPSRVDTREIGKWGYCTRAGRLTFSWQLAALPERLREYVVVHELAHLKEFNHSQTFKRIVASVCADFSQREKELDAIVPYDRLKLL